MVVGLLHGLDAWSEGEQESWSWPAPVPYRGEEDACRKGLGHPTGQGVWVSCRALLCWQGLAHAGQHEQECDQWVLPLVVLVRPHPKMVSCFAPLLTISEGLSCGVWGEVEWGGFAWLGNGKAKEGPWWWCVVGLAGKVQLGSPFSQDESEGVEKSFHDWLELVRSVLAGRGSPCHCVTFRRNCWCCCCLPCHWLSCRAVPWPWGQVSGRAGSGLYLRAVAQFG